MVILSENFGRRYVDENLSIGRIDRIDGAIKSTVSGVIEVKEPIQVTVNIDVKELAELVKKELEKEQ